MRSVVVILRIVTKARTLAWVRCAVVAVAAIATFYAGGWAGALLAPDGGAVPSAGRPGTARAVPPALYADLTLPSPPAGPPPRAPLSDEQRCANSDERLGEACSHGMDKPPPGVDLHRRPG